MLYTEKVAISRSSWELSQIEIHNLRQLVGVVLVNCQLAQRRTHSWEEAGNRSLRAIHAQQASQFEAFRSQFSSDSSPTPARRPRSRS